MSETLFDTKPCLFSACRQYRYTLWREWDPLFNNQFLMVVGLNPSTADETKDDPTIRRCVDFAKRWGFGALLMTNLFAIRATDPKVMMAHADPTGELNDQVLLHFAPRAGKLLAAWGAQGSHLNRDHYITALLGDKFECLGFTGGMQPRHPLYVAASTPPIRFE
jgi:hypothetical protein